MPHAPTVQRAVDAIARRYGEARFPERDLPQLRVELGADGEILAEAGSARARGRLSAPLLLAAELWAGLEGRFDGDLPILEPPIGSNGDVEDPLDRDAAASLAEAGLALLRAGLDQEGRRCVRRAIDVTTLLPGVEVPEALWSELCEPTAVEAESRRSTTPNALAKRVAPFAESPNEAERWQCADLLHLALHQLHYSDRLAFDRAAGPALERLAVDPVAAIRERALLALDYLAWKLWCVAAYPEARPHLDLLIEAGWHSDLQLSRRWEARLALGDDAGAAADLDRLRTVGRPDEVVRLAANFFDHGDWTDVRILGLVRCAEARLAWARGGDPCADRLRRRHKPRLPAAEERAHHLAGAHALLEEAASLAATRTEEARSLQPSDDGASGRGFLARIPDLRADLARERGDATAELRALLEADELDRHVGLEWRRGRHDPRMRELVASLPPDAVLEIDPPARIREATLRVEERSAAPTIPASPAPDLLRTALQELREATCDAAGTEREWALPEDLHLAVRGDLWTVETGGTRILGSPSAVRLLALRVWDAVIAAGPPLSRVWDLDEPDFWSLRSLELEPGWEEVGRELWQEGSRDEALRCLRRAFRIPRPAETWTDAELPADLAPGVATALRTIPAGVERVVTLLATGKTTPVARWKSLVPLAGADDPVARLWLAETLHAEISSYAPSRVLARCRHLSAPLLRLAQDPDPAVAEAGLFASHTLGLQLHREGAYAEAEPHLDLSVTTGLQTAPSLYRRWVCRQALGHLEPAADPDGLFPDRFGPSAEVAARLDAARALSAWADGRNPCPHRASPSIPVALRNVDLRARALELLERTDDLDVDADDRSEVEELRSELR